MFGAVAAIAENLEILGSAGVSLPLAGSHDGPRSSQLFRFALIEPAALPADAAIAWLIGEHRGPPALGAQASAAERKTSPLEQRSAPSARQMRGSS